MKKYISISILTVLLIYLLLVAANKQKEHSVIKKNKLLYENGLVPVKDKNNPFCPEPQLLFYDSMEMLPSITVRQAMITQFYKVLTLLKMGQEPKAVDILKPLAEKLEINPKDKLAIDSKKYLALTYLRLGERSNCINGHSSGSCIFPIKGSGIYMDPTASQHAIKV